MFIAKKPCSFAGKFFRIGDAIPGELVHGQAVSFLINSGYIAKHPNPEAAAAAAGNEPENHTYSEAELSKMTKDELIGIANGLGLEVADNDTKKVIIACILDEQEVVDNG